MECSLVEEGADTDRYFLTRLAESNYELSVIFDAVEIESRHRSKIIAMPKTEISNICIACS